MPPGSTISLFIVAASILVVIPGPNTFYIITSSLHQGLAAGVVSSLGILVGTVFHISAAAFGLSIAAILRLGIYPGKIRRCGLPGLSRPENFSVEGKNCNGNGIRPGKKSDRYLLSRSSGQCAESQNRAVLRCVSAAIPRCAWRLHRWPDLYPRRHSHPFRRFQRHDLCPARWKDRQSPAEKSLLRPRPTLLGRNGVCRPRRGNRFDGTEQGMTTITTWNEMLLSKTMKPKKP